MEEDQWNIAVEGAMIAAMDADDRWATIIDPKPEYKKDEQAEGNVQKHKLKLIAQVKLSDGREAQYYMNRTSARKIAVCLKTDLSPEAMNKWVGAKIVWGTIADQNIGGQMKKVLYVTEASKPDSKSIPETSVQA